MTRSITWRKDYNGFEVSFPLTRVLFEERTALQHVMIAETAPFGLGFFLDLFPQTLDSDEWIYHQVLAHPSMLAHPDPRRVLIVGCAEGCTLREVMTHPGVEEVVALDIDGRLVEICREHLTVWNRGAYDDPRVRTVHEDASTWIRRQPAAQFDVILLALGDPIGEAHSSACFTVEFYQGVKRLLREGGIASAQAGEVDHFRPHGFRSILTTWREVFGAKTDYFVQSIPSYCADWGFLIGGATFASLDPARLSARIASSGVDFEHGSFQRLGAVPARLRRVLETPGRLLTADRPFTQADLEESRT